MLKAHEYDEIQTFTNYTNAKEQFKMGSLQTVVEGDEEGEGEVATLPGGKQVKIQVQGKSVIGIVNGHGGVPGGSPALRHKIETLPPFGKKGPQKIWANFTSSVVTVTSLLIEMLGPSPWKKIQSLAKTSKSVSTYASSIF